METVWEMKEGKETAGTIRGGLRRGTVKFKANITKGGYYYFVCSLPHALNAKGSVRLEKLHLQQHSLLRRNTSAKRSNFSVDVSIDVSNDYQKIFSKRLKLGMGTVEEDYICFEVPKPFTPAIAEITLEGHSLFKRLHLAASLTRYGEAPKSAEDGNIVARMGKFLLTKTMNIGEENYYDIMKQEKQALMADTQDYGIFARQHSLGSLTPPGSVSRQASDFSTMSNSSQRSVRSQPKRAKGMNDFGIYELKSSRTVGDAFFFLVHRGILSAPVWDVETKQYLGFFDSQDAMDVTLKLREIGERNILGRSRQRSGSVTVKGIEISSKEATCWYGLDLKISKFFSSEDNRQIAKWNPVTPKSKMSEALDRLGSGTRRIPVIESGGKVCKIISQSEIMNLVFHKFISKNIDPQNRKYFETTKLSADAIKRGTKSFFLRDSVFKAFKTIMVSDEIDAIPVLDANKRFVANLSPVDVWFLCKMELEGSKPYKSDLKKLTIEEFLKNVKRISGDLLEPTKRDCAISVTTNSPLSEVITKMVRFKIHGVYVIEETTGSPLGRIRVRDVIRALIDDEVELFHVNANIKDVFLWDKESGPEPMFSASSLVRGAAARAAKSRNKRINVDRFAPGVILSAYQQASLENALPLRLEGGTWRTAYNMKRYGMSALAIREAVSNKLQPLVLVVQSTDGFRFGAFLPTGFYSDGTYNDHQYIEGPGGDGESFVFSFGASPENTAPTIFKWTGENRYFRMLNADRGLGVGGGGAGFAIYIDSMLKTGTSDMSDTYHNTCLARSRDFQITQLE
eukprot:CAMPEP_0203761278 /NCGR_PEP_ID=MMETSP0098-20131031/14393_1 /ASSEMBLY_ACC=CAM_ASM_000208 /TAXON_ID=96639 /ORGANISM=" , Strain NY0313808BC1" /LENGTH=795 /DNA_ID=CAMNT_0050655189 /DNA_START=137 /DNA_END=2521 /DNA_ORIENTATION=+